MLFGFSVISYANALPLVHFLDGGLYDAERICSPPRYAVQSLLNGQVDAALVPVVDLFNNPELEMVPGLGIAADGDVTSVLLQCHCPLKQVNTIALDSESKTSNVLVKILAQRHFRMGSGVTFTENQFDGDACVCIGDRALVAEPAFETYDLAGQWKKLTGLPFVFAVWVVHRSCPHTEEIARILHLAKQRGYQSRRQLANLCNQRLAVPVDLCYDYLTRRLHYDLDDRDMEGMSLFRAWAAEFLPSVASRDVRTMSKSRQNVGWQH